MKRLAGTLLAIFFIFFINICFCAPKKTTSLNLDTQKIQTITGFTGQYDSYEKVFKITWPIDKKIVVAGVTLTPDMGLTSWIAFKKINNQVIAMGDFVLLADQVNAVMSSVLDNGLQVTALHNHFLWDTPRVMFMHIGGTGNESELATKISKVLTVINATKNNQAVMSSAKIEIAKSTLSPGKIDAILNVKGQFAKGVYKVVIGKNVKMDDFILGKTMGVNTWAAFAGSDSNAIVDGDFAVHEDELQRVLIALRKYEINVVSVHQHMIGEKPHIIFIHYWGNNSIDILANGLRAALNETKG